MMIGSSDETVRVDLHLHSRASGSATNVWVKGLGDDGDVRESYTLPEESYRMAKRAGMNFVTLTDHETIDGSLTLLHHPDFLVGELLLYVGRVSKEKGLERLLPRYLDLRSRRQDVHLVVVGDGPYREEMESALGREVTFAGFLQGEELARLFAYCDIFVFPSATDTLGRGRGPGFRATSRGLRYRGT